MVKVESIGLRTAWLATLAGWAVVVWLLALAGMGMRVEPLPDDPTLVPRLPALPAPAPERLGEFARYAAIAARPVFAEDRQPHPFFLSGGNGSEASKVRLTGVLLTDTFQMATLTTEQGQSIRLRLGDSPQQGWRLLTLEARQATVEGPGGTLVLELAVFDGKGGQPATVLGTVAGGDGRPQPVQAPAPPLPAPPDHGAAANGNGTDAAVQVPAPAGRQQVPQGNAQMPSEDQLRAIRERIEARRRQLREQGAARPGQNP